MKKNQTNDQYGNLNFSMVNKESQLVLIANKEFTQK
jgi:hypothetical protein